MSNHPELSSAYDTLRLNRDAGSGDTRSAVLAALRRYERGSESAADTLTILQALGLVAEPQEQENRLPSAATMARSRRRAKARERAREEREAS